MNISACVIVKNEGKNLPKWLECMKQVADELIVVDTGSTDDTVALAENAGARVFHYEWHSDFAAAKNFAIEQAQGDWIFFLDADEYFSDDTLQIIRQEMEAYHRKPEVGVVLCSLINIDSDNYDKVINTILQSRIFRNLPGIRYKGDVHEQLTNSGNSMQMVCNKNLVILHTGYSTSIVREKSRRNLPMLLERERNATTDFEKGQTASFLADAYNCLGEYGKAIEYAHIAIEHNVQHMGMEGRSYELIFSAMQCLGTSQEEQVKLLEEAAEKYPKEPVFVVEKGHVLWLMERYDEAEVFLQKGLHMYQEQEKKLGSAQFAANNAASFLPYLYSDLGDIARRKGDIARGAEFCFIGLQHYRYHPGLLTGLYECLSDNDVTELIQLINSIFDKDKDSSYIVKVLSGKADRNLLTYYLKYAKDVRAAEAFLLVERYDAAAVAAAAAIRQDSEKLLRMESDLSEQEKRSMGVLLASAYRENVIRIMDICQYPLVSIMIPTYNRPELFEKTLQSAMAQTYPNVEILVNDNSTDDATQQLMEKYVTDDRIRYFRNRLAVCKADNFAPFEEMAAGEYLQWCMDDDILVPEKLACMVPVLRDNPQVALVTSQRGFIDEQGCRLADMEDKIIYTDAPWMCFAKEAIGKCMLTEIYNFIGEPTAVLFRRKDLQNHYWQADCRGYKAISDVVMWLELLEKGDMVVFREPLSYYRRHAGQEGQSPEVVLLSRLEWLSLLKEYRQRGVFIDETSFQQGLVKLKKDFLQMQQESSIRQAANFAEYAAAMKSC